MILYDEKLNFIGMSERTLNFLGYEDIAEFMSMNKDVADLFIKEEGYIHKFDNFSWIDFILYSGSKTKKAMIKLKNGDQTKIDLSIKEVFLNNKLDENKKLYSVKLISDNFQNISDTKNENVKKSANNFSLNNMITDENKETETKKVDNLAIEAKEEKLNILGNNIQNETISNSNNLDFELNSPNTVKTQDNKDSANFGHLDFLSKEEEIEKDEPTINFLKQSNTNESTQTEDDSLNFNLKSTQDNPKKQTKQQPQQFENDTNIDFNLKSTNTKETIETNDLNFLKNDNELKVVNDLKNNILETNTEQKKDILSSDFLIKDENKPEMINDVKDSTIKTDTEEVKNTNSLDFLNFLKIEDKLEEQTPSISSQNILKTDDKIEPKLNFLNKNMLDNNDIPAKTEKLQIIKQIKKDIKEIDGTEQEVIQNISETEKTEDESYSQPLFLDQEDKTDPSFVNTLKSLFDEEESKNISQSKDKLDIKSDQIFSFNMRKKENDDIETTQNKKIKTQDQEKSKITNTPKKPLAVNKQSIYASLQPLGLNQEQEQNLIIDFVEDSKESLESMKQFITIKDFDKIKYCLVKIKSSAEILNLDDIITLTNSLKNSCDSKNIEAIIQHQDNLNTYIDHLEKEILKDTV